MEEEFNRNCELNDTLASLKAIPNAWDFLNGIFDAENPQATLSRCMIPIDLSNLHNKFHWVMRVTLIDFCTAYLTNPGDAPTNNLERTFWVQSIVPMFKFFAGTTGLIKFSW